MNAEGRLKKLPGLSRALAGLTTATARSTEASSRGANQSVGGGTEKEESTTLGVLVAGLTDTSSWPASAEGLQILQTPTYYSIGGNVRVVLAWLKTWKRRFPSVVKESRSLGHLLHCLVHYFRGDGLREGDRQGEGLLLLDIGAEYKASNGLVVACYDGREGRRGRKHFLQRSHDGRSKK